MMVDTTTVPLPAPTQQQAANKNRNKTSAAPAIFFDGTCTLIARTGAGGVHLENVDELAVRGGAGRDPFPVHEVGVAQLLVLQDRAAIPMAQTTSQPQREPDVHRSQAPNASTASIYGIEGIREEYV